jgi:hypothetical protein
MIYQSAFRNATILNLQMISLHTCKVVVLGYKIDYRCRTTCMILTILQYRKEMADIIANNIFHKKATVKACQPSRPKSC